MTRTLFLVLFAVLVVGARTAVDVWPDVLRELARHEDSSCGQHAARLLAELNNATFWAAQMLDSSGRLPSGVLSGNIYSLGHFDECIAAVNPAADVHGQYCLASLRLLQTPGSRFNRSRVVHEAVEAPDPASSAWEYLQNNGERWRAPRDVLHIALCVPDSCSAQLVQNATQTALESRAAAELGVRIDVKLPSALCSTAADFQTPFYASDYIFCSLVGLLVLLAVSSTLYDLLAPVDETSRSDLCLWRRIFLAFAARKHFLGLGKMESSGEQDLNFLFGLRLASILLVILCHKAGFSTAGPNMSPGFQEMTFSQLRFMPLLHADLVVDTFFFLAGFLLTVGLLRALRRPETRLASTIWPLYVFRYMRLTPAYLLTVFFYATLMPRMGNGPLWKVTVIPEHEYCVKNWWLNALYLNNYINVDNMCIEQSWYMPCDMHFFLLSVPLLVLLHRRPHWGWTLLATFLILSVIAPLVVIYAMDTDAMLLFLFDFLRGSRMHTYFANLYVKSHLRAGPYFVGLIFGWIFLQIGTRKINKIQGYVLLVTSLVACTATSLTGVLFYDPDGMHSSSTAARAVYGGVHRTGWAAALGLFVVAVSAGRIGWVKAVLSWKPLVALSKLSYGAYLIHIVVLWYSAGSVRQPLYSDSVLVILRTWGDTVATFILALFLYLIVEAPIRDITKILLASGAKRADRIRHRKTEASV